MLKIILSLFLFIIILYFNNNIKELFQVTTSTSNSIAVLQNQQNSEQVTQAIKDVLTTAVIQPTSSSANETNWLKTIYPTDYDNDICVCHGDIVFTDEDGKKESIKKKQIEKYNKLGLFYCNGREFEFETKINKNEIDISKTKCDINPKNLNVCAEHNDWCNCKGTVYYGSHETGEYIPHINTDDKKCDENLNIKCIASEFDPKKTDTDTGTSTEKCYCDGTILTNTKLFDTFVLSITNNDKYKIKYINKDFFDYKDDTQNNDNDNDNNTKLKINSDKLQKIYLNNNSIEYFHAKTFVKLTNLRILDLTGNPIVFFYENLFNKNNKLEYIIISEKENTNEKIKILLSKDIYKTKNNSITKQNITELLGITNDNFKFIENPGNMAISEDKDYDNYILQEDNYNTYFEFAYKDDYINEKDMGLYSCKHKNTDIDTTDRRCFKTRFSNQPMSCFEANLKRNKIKQLMNKYNTEIKIFNNPDMYALKIEDKKLLAGKKDIYESLSYDLLDIEHNERFYGCKEFLKIN